MYIVDCVFRQRRLYEEEKQLRHLQMDTLKYLWQQVSSCSSSGFPLVGVRLVYWSIHCTATFVIFFDWSQLLAFSLHLSSSSAFLRSLFTQSSHRSCGLPRFLQPPCVFISDLFCNPPSFILTMCPVHLIRLLTILPTIQALVLQFLLHKT